MRMPSLTSPGVDRAVEDRRAVSTSCLSTSSDSAKETADAGDRDRVRPARPIARPNRPATIAGGERQQRARWRGAMSFHAQPFSASRSSTLMLRRLRNSTTRIARPIADSAAATVRMKNTKTCPVHVAEVARERDEVEVDREQHQLDAHQQQDHVLAVDEDPGDAEANSSPRHVSSGQRDHSPALRVHLDDAHAVLARTATCAAMSCTFRPGRLAHRQRDRGDDRDQQHHGRQLERDRRARCRARAELLGVAVVGRLRRGGWSRRARAAEPTRRGRSRTTTIARRAAERQRSA
jgi:hypothetical protein